MPLGHFVPCCRPAKTSSTSTCCSTSSSSTSSLFLLLLAALLALGCLLPEPVEAARPTRQARQQQGRQARPLRQKMLQGKRDPAGFYTTRFGRRSDPSMPNPHLMDAATAAAMAPSTAAAADADRLAELRSYDEAYAMGEGHRLGSSIEGYDDRGQAVACFATAPRGFYICRKEENAWSLT